ncbi:MAG: hypothetical protein ACXWLL_08540 [Myxococcaceae bacterium]
MLDETLSNEIHGWRWVWHSVLEGVLIVALLCAAGPLTLMLVDGGGASVAPQDAVAELSAHSR